MSKSVAFRWLSLAFRHLSGLVRVCHADSGLALDRELVSGQWFNLNGSILGSDGYGYGYDEDDRPVSDPVSHELLGRSPAKKVAKPFHLDSR